MRGKAFRSEFVIAAVTGKEWSSSAALNEALKTGDIKVIATDITRYLRQRHLHSDREQPDKDEVRLNTVI